MNKKTRANIIMVAIIVLMAVVGIVSALYIKGDINTNKENAALLTEFRGIVVLERNGVALTTTEDTYLRTGDKITCSADATAKIALDDGYIVLGRGVEANVICHSTSNFDIEVEKGEIFVNTASKVIIEYEGKSNEIKDAVANLNVRKGAQSISVYYGTVEDAKAGQLIEWIGSERQIRNFSIESLNDFNIAQIRKANEEKELVFTNAELEQLELDRWAQIQQENENVKLDSQTDKVEVEQKESTDEKTELNSSEETTKKVESSSEKKTESNSEETTKKADSSNKETTTKKVESATTETTTKEPEATTEKEKDKKTCTITIRCDTILNNWDELDMAKAPYVPESGCILPTITVEFTDGETVFDVLKRTCDKYGIQIEYSWTPMYDSYYVEGINNLYEFDCGFESGWMYKVNGWFPNYGCSSYDLLGGETIVWCYTCKGLGEDVGASMR